MQNQKKIFTAIFMSILVLFQSHLYSKSIPSKFKNLAVKSSSNLINTLFKTNKKYLKIFINNLPLSNKPIDVNTLDPLTKSITKFKKFNWNERKIEEDTGVIVLKSIDLIEKAFKGKFLDASTVTIKEDLNTYAPLDYNSIGDTVIEKKDGTKINGVTYSSRNFHDVMIEVKGLIKIEDPSNIEKYENTLAEHTKKTTNFEIVKEGSNTKNINPGIFSFSTSPFTLIKSTHADNLYNIRYQVRFSPYSNPQNKNDTKTVECKKAVEKFKKEIPNYSNTITKYNYNINSNYRKKNKSQYIEPTRFKNGINLCIVGPKGRIGKQAFSIIIKQALSNQENKINLSFAYKWLEDKDPKKSKDLKEAFLKDLFTDTDNPFMLDKNNNPIKLYVKTKDDNLFEIYKKKSISVAEKKLYTIEFDALKRTMTIKDTKTQKSLTIKILANKNGYYFQDYKNLNIEEAVINTAYPTCLYFCSGENKYENLESIHNSCLKRLKANGKVYKIKDTPSHSFFVKLSSPGKNMPDSANTSIQYITNPDEKTIKVIKSGKPIVKSGASCTTNVTAPTLKMLNTALFKVLHPKEYMSLEKETTSYMDIVNKIKIYKKDNTIKETKADHIAETTHAKTPSQKTFPDGSKKTPERGDITQSSSSGAGESTTVVNGNEQIGIFEIISNRINVNKPASAVNMFTTIKINEKYKNNLSTERLKNAIKTLIDKYPDTLGRAIGYDIMNDSDSLTNSKTGGVIDLSRIIVTKTKEKGIFTIKSSYGYNNEKGFTNQNLNLIDDITNYMYRNKGTLVPPILKKEIPVNKNNQDDNKKPKTKNTETQTDLTKTDMEKEIKRISSMLSLNNLDTLTNYSGQKAFEKESIGTFSDYNDRNSTYPKSILSSPKKGNSQQFNIKKNINTLNLYIDSLNKTNAPFKLITRQKFQITSDINENIKIKENIKLIKIPIEFLEELNIKYLKMFVIEKLIEFQLKKHEEFKTKSKETEEFKNTTINKGELWLLQETIKNAFIYFNKQKIDYIDYIQNKEQNEIIKDAKINCITALNTLKRNMGDIRYEDEILEIFAKSKSNLGTNISTGQSEFIKNTKILAKQA